MILQEIHDFVNFCRMHEGTDEFCHVLCTKLTICLHFAVILQEIHYFSISAGCPEEICLAFCTKFTICLDFAMIFAGFRSMQALGCRQLISGSCCLFVLTRSTAQGVGGLKIELLIFIPQSLSQCEFNSEIRFEFQF